MDSPAHAYATVRVLPDSLDIPDATAVREIIEGNKEMFRIIVRRYNPQLYRVGMAYLRNHAQAEDAMQNAYLKAFLNLRNFHGAAAFATWLTRIMINECLMLLRREKRFVVEDDREHPAQIDPETLPAPAATDTMHAEEMKAVLEQTIQELPRSHRTVYILREVQHLSTAETAACLGLTEENVKVCLHRARERLKSQLLKNAAGIELFAYPACRCDPMTARVMQAVLSL